LLEAQLASIELESNAKLSLPRPECYKAYHRCVFKVEEHTLPEGPRTGSCVGRALESSEFSSFPKTKSTTNFEKVSNMLVHVSCAAVCCCEEVLCARQLKKRNKTVSPRVVTDFFSTAFCVQRTDQ
jgi:hypothetical protein